ncbi:MAG: hypothetical protein KBT39_02825 [Bacteroidales bacterium]|nr:hypothetical protein [Bacteroidales bacterium]
MRQHIVRMVLLCMVMMCGGGSVWGREVPYTVGATDCSTGYWEATSDEYALDGDGTYHFVFVNHNPGSGANWLNWILRAFDTSDNELLALRADYYGWGTLYTESGRSGDINWDDFMTNMNGAEVDMTVTRSGNMLTMSSSASKGGNKLWDYGYAVTNASIPNQIKLLLGVEKAYLEITEATYKAPETPDFSLVDGGTYILKNVETGKFLAAGNSWGTQASLMDAPDPFVVKQNNGKYSFSSVVCNNDGSFPGSWNAASHDSGHANHYLSGTFCDGAATWFTVSPVGDNVALTVDGTNYLQGNGAIVDMGATSSTAASAQWKLYNIDDYALDATPNNPLNVTYYVGDGNFGRNNINFPKWHMNASNQNLKGGDNTNICAESYHSTFTLSQELKDIPSGVYQLTAQGFYRQDGSDNTNLPYFYANNEIGTFPQKTGEENSMTDASNSFKTGVYTISPIKVLVTDGKLTIGAKLENNTALWCIWDNFQLTFLGQFPTITYSSDETSISVEMTDLPTNGTVYWHTEGREFTPYSEIISVTDPTTLYYKVVYNDGSESDVYSEKLVFPATPELSADASLRISVDTSQKINVETNSNGAVTYTGYDEDIVAVSADGVVTAIAEGNTAVTVNVAATKDYRAASVVVPIVVPSEGVGSVKLLADIDFSNDIVDGAIAGRVNSMTLSNVSAGTPYMKGWNGGNTDVLRVGNGTGTVTIDKSKIGERDVVTASFDMYFGSLINLCAGVDLNDENGDRIAGFYYSKYSGKVTGAYDDFGMDWGKISSVGSSSSSNSAIYVSSNKTTFTITLDYMLGTMSIVAENGQFGRQERSVPMSNLNPIYQFVLKTNYTNDDRRCWFDNLKIKVTEGDYTIEPAEYTVKYQVENGTEVKDAVVRKSLPGRIVTLGTTDTGDFKNDGNTKKYIYVSDNASEVRVAEDGSSVITVLFREAAEYTWRLTTTVDSDTELPSGTSFEGDVTTVSYPTFIVDKQGNLYSTTQLSDDNKQYAVSFTADKNGFEQPLEYTATGDKNIVFLSEAEDVQGLIITNEGGCATRTSGGRAAYAAAAATLVKGLPRGSYVLTGFVYNNTNNTVHELLVNVGDINIWSLRTNTNGLANATSEPFGIKDESTEITIPACGGVNIAFDLFYIRRVGDFAGDPVITKNLKSSYKVEREQKIPMAIQADNAPWFKWYKWTADPETFNPETLNITDGNATLLEASKSNSYTYTGTSNGKEYIFAEVVGYGSSVYSHLAEVKTIDPLGDEGAVTLIFAQDYNNATVTDWIGSGNNSIGTKDGDKCTMISNTQSGPRASYIQLSSKFDDAPSLQNGTWILDYDFSPGAVGTREGNIQGFAVYNKALGMPTSNTNYAPDAVNVFFGLDTKEANSNVYIPYLGGVAHTENEVELVPGDWYHVHLEVTNSSIEVQLTNGKGRAVVYEGNSSQALTTGMDLGGIHQFIPREGGAAYFDNIELKIKTNQPIVASDLPEFSEGNDDYYLNEGEGLNFDVPAATEFEWYVSSVAPSATADGTTAPKLNEDGSVTWSGQPFMTVESPVGRGTTTITKTKGDELSTSGKHVVEPAKTGNGSYAYQLVGTYPTVKTVWDEAVTESGILRYYPEATASGSRWHYLRQLDSNTEGEHIDYVWCVASNALGDVTSKVAQIEIYPQAPLIYLLDDYQHMDADGDRYDMTLPANYKFRNTSVKINANNLIFSTKEKPVPHKTVSYIQYLDESGKEYTTNAYPFDAARDEWKNGDDVWNGVLSTTQFTDLDFFLNAHSSVHGFYKSFGASDKGVQIDFTYGLRQMLRGAEYHNITKNSDDKYVLPHGGAQYVIGVQDQPSLQGRQTFYCDYGRYPATEFGSVNTKTTWDWSTLPERSLLTYNTTKYTTAEQQQTYLHEINGTTYVIDPETGLGGPEMGNEYLMADFYGYKPEELGGFPSDKVMLGIEYINEPDDHCMQGNAFIFKPTEEGTLTVTFSSTDGNQTRYLELCTRENVDGADTKVTSYGSTTSSGNAAAERHTITMDITTAMKNKFVVVRARNTEGQPDNTGTGNQYFRIYSATYTPTTKPVEFTEWKVQDRAVGDPDVYEKAGSDKSDGYVSITTNTPGAVIKYKMIVGTDKTPEDLNAIAADIDKLNEEECVYDGNAYSDTEGNKVGIHCRVNSTIFAWAEIEGMNRSEVSWLKTNAATYPVDLRFMTHFDTSSITTQDDFDRTYWGMSQSSLAGITIEQMKENSTEKAPKAWEKEVKKFGTAYIDGLEYTAVNFDKLFITHGAVIDCYINPAPEYKFDGWGAPSFKETDAGNHTGEVVDMMRSGAKAKYVHYHLLYDKAKAAATAGIAYLVANFTERTDKDDITAQIYVKESDVLEDDYKINIPVYKDNEGYSKIIAPVYHTAHKDDGFTVTHWTDDYRPADNEGHYEDYFAGIPKQIYQNTLIKPVYRENTYLDNYLGRTQPLEATWWFTIDHDAQSLSVAGEPASQKIPYVAPVKRSMIGTVAKDSKDDITFDLPMIITPGTTGRLNNSVTSDWCSVGRGVKFTVPVCKGTDVTMEVRSPLSSAAGGTTFGGEIPVLWKVKYKGEAEYTETSTPEASKTVESYIYRYTYTGDGETCDIVLGNDYSYMRRIGVSMPVVTSNRDAALITLHFDELGKLSDYGEGNTGDGYDFHSNANASTYKAHYSKEEGAIYHKDVTLFDVTNPIAANIPYVNGIVGFTKSEEKDGTFIVGPFRSITHIRYQQGCSVLGGGGWTMTVGRKTDYDPDQRATYTVESFKDVEWSEAKYGSLHNTTTPQWVEMDIEEHIGKDNIKDPDFDTMQGDIFLRFQADKPDVYLFAIEIYGIDPTSDQQVTLETGVLAAQKDADTKYESSLRAGSIFHFPYLLQLDEEYKPMSSVKGSDNKRMQFNEGREVSLTANPNLGYDFLKWVKPDGNGGWTDVSTANPYKFNISENTDLRAVFVHRGIINYTADRTNYGLMPEQVQTGKTGDFTVADNRGLYAGVGQSLRMWQDAMPTHEWYKSTDGAGQKNTFNVSTNSVGVTTESKVEKSRAMEGDVVDVYPQFTANTLELIDVVGRQGVTARWQFGKKNGALTMEGKGTTPRIVTQAVITGTKEVVKDNGDIGEQTMTETIDVSMQMTADVNNAGRADEYATVKPANRYTIPATRGMQIAFNAKEPIQYSIDGGATFQAYNGAFKYYGNDSELVIALRDADNNEASFELEYIQATYYQRAQKPVLSMQKVDVIGLGASNNIQVDVQTSDNPTAVRFYTLDGSDPQYEATEKGVVPKPGTNTRLVRGNYITINESQIKSGSQLKVLSVCPDRPDSRLSILDLEPYDPSLGLATYVYDSRIISIHNDQIFQKLLKEHKGHFNLLSYDLNPEAARIPDIITDHTTVFVTSDAVRDHLMTALTTPSDAAAHGQAFFTSAVEVGSVYKSKPFIIGTPTTIWWNEGYTKDTPANTTAQGYFILDAETHKFIAQNPDNDHPLDLSGTTVYYKLNNTTTTPSSGWQGMTWVSQVPSEKPIENPATPTSPATITYTEMLRRMKGQPTRVDPSKTYKQYYADQITAAGGDYRLAFYDNMLLDDSLLCISNTTDNAPENLSANGTQLVFNATELLTRITDGNPADVSTYNKTLLALMAPTKNPQVIDIAMTYTQDVIDRVPDKDWIPLDAPMLSALSDGKTEMSMPYLASSYPQFKAGTINNYGKVEVKNVEVAAPDDNTSEKLGAQGVKDLATIIELTDLNNADFKREYRVEYNVATEELTFHKEGGEWVCNETDLCTVEESTKDGCPFFKLLGPQNYGIKSVSFNGYAVAPSEYFENGEIMEGKTIWGQGEKYNDDAMLSPTAYHVTTPLIPEYPSTSAEADRTPLSNSGQWMTSEFPWGFKDCYQMAFSLLNINEYVGDIKVTYYRRQAESPKLLSAKVKYKSMEQNIADDMILAEPNGEFVLEFNSVMHAVRKPGTYDSATGQEAVTWTAHIIDGDIYEPALEYAKVHASWSKIDEIDGKDKPGRIELSAEGGSNILRFQYWELEPGKKYYLHIPFMVLRGAVGTGVPYVYPASVDGLPEKHMSWTDYPSVPYFDIPFTVKKAEYKYQKFNYIVSNDDWWNVLKEDPSSPKHGEYPTAGSRPSYATWDGSFTDGIDKIKALTAEHDRFYMHVQKNLNGKYIYTGKDDYDNEGLIQLHATDFSITGEGCDSTIITAEPAQYGLDAGYSGLNEKNNKSTFHIDGSKVYIQDVTLQNTQKGQNVDGQEYPALFDHGNRNIFYGVNIDAYEESFAVFGSYSYLKNSRVSGFGDFIVGSGDVWLDSCDIVLRNRELINLCAPSTKATNKWGFVFNGCNITREAGASLVLDHNWTLARPWKGHDTDVPKSPAVTFLNTTMEVQPTNSGYGVLDENLVLRFHEYGTKDADGSAVSLSTRSIANCLPDPSSDAPTLTPEQAEEYTVANVFGKDNGGYDPEALTKQAKAPRLANDGMVLHWNADPSDLCYLVYYLGDGEKPDYQHAQMFCCVPGTDEKQAYCYLTNHDISPIFRTGEPGKTPISFSEMWYGRRKSDPYGSDYDGEEIPGMGKASPSRLWFAVRAANQMGGLSEMSNALMYRAARQYRTKITSGGAMQDDNSGNAYSTIYLDFQALAPSGVKAYALTDVSAAGDESIATTLTFTRENNDDTQQDVIRANQGYLICGPYTDDIDDKSQTEKDHTFIETTADPTVPETSYLGGTIGTFLNKVAETGLGETNEISIDGQGWSVNPVDYDNISKGNINAFTLQSYNYLLGFYKFTGTMFAHHRAYLDADEAARVLMENGMTKEEAEEHLVKGLRFVIREPDGTETEISSVFMDEDTKDGIYDLEGRRLSSRKQLKPGHIYIIDGQKVMWKR